MFDIRLEGKLPIYEQLCNGIIALISNEELKPDEKLPPVREVAKKLGVNPNTVQKAYSVLEQSGFIYSIPAKGSYVSSNDKATKAMKADALKRLASELGLAKRSGVEQSETIALVNEIWE